MKKTTGLLMIAFLGMVLVAFGAGIVSAQTVTITGTVNDENQIVVNEDTVYTIGDTEKGDELLEYVDKKVQVTGDVEEQDGEKVIFVTSYKVLEE